MIEDRPIPAATEMHRTTTEAENRRSPLGDPKKTESLPTQALKKKTPAVGRPRSGR
jgi:hypothetical protein